MSPRRFASAELTAIARSLGTASLSVGRSVGATSPSVGRSVGTTSPSVGCARSSLRRTIVAAAIAIVAGVAIAGCAQQSTSEDEPRPAPRAADGPAAPACACEEQAVVDPPLLAFLSLARAAHHEADLAIDAKDRGKAITSLERVTKAAWQGKKPPEVIEVTADTLARLADLRSEDGKFDEAARDVDAGIALATEPTHYRGRLFELRGVVEQRREKALKDKGDTAGAAKARDVAMDAFDQAMSIQEDVIGRMLKEKEKEDQKGRK